MRFVGGNILAGIEADLGRHLGIAKRGIEIDRSRKGRRHLLQNGRTDGRVLVIECKDVQFRKTLGEMAEQLADFRGEIRANGKRDELRKHLDRVGIIRQHLPQLAEFVGRAGVDAVESHLLFRNPVPMEFALVRMADQVQVSNFGAIASI